MNIAVEIKNNYGSQAIYPANPAAVLFAQLLNQKTLTARDIGLIKQLGYGVEQVSAQAVI